MSLNCIARFCTAGTLRKCYYIFVAFTVASNLAMTEEATDGELLDLVASQLYDSGGDRVPLDMHSACAVGNYKCVQEWIDAGVDLDAKNRGLVRGCEREE